MSYSAIERLSEAVIVKSTPERVRADALKAERGNLLGGAATKLLL